MKVLILSCNTGGGHNSAARAISAELEGRGIYSHIKNAMEFVPKAKQDFIEKGHSFMYKYAPDIYGRVYERTEQLERHRMLYIDYAQFALPLAQYIKRRGYDTVICVHEFPAFMLTAARKLFGLKVKQYFVATDYALTPGIEETLMDAWFVPKGFAAEYAGAGLPEDRIFETGIPVDSVFYSHPDRDDVRRRLGLRDDLPVIIVAAGSIGCGPIEELVDELRKRKGTDAVIAVMCGKNRSLLRAFMYGRSDAFLIPLGFVDNVPDWFAAGDVLITKPGGLSTTEAASAGIPMVFMNAVPGLETHNLEYFTSHGCGCYAVGVSELCDGVDIAYAKRKTYLKNQKKLFSSNSVRELTDTVISGVAESQENLPEGRT